MLPKRNEIKTERLLLRPFLSSDEKTACSIFTDPLVSKTYMFPDFKDEEQVKDLFRRFQKASENPDAFVYAAALDGELIGFTNYVTKDETSTEIGYVIRSDCWNKGYATEILKAAIAELFRMGYQKVICGHFEENPASGRVMQKAGMLKTDRTETIAYRGVDHLVIIYEIDAR